MPLSIQEKLSFTLFLVLAAFAFPWQANLAAVLLLITARLFIFSLRPVTIESARRFLKFFSLFVTLSILMVFLNSALIPGREILFSIGGVRFSQEGLAFGVITGARLLLLVTALLTLFGSTPISELADYLDRAGLPTALVLTILLTVYFLDTLPSRIQQILIAQEARGAPVRGGLIARTRSVFAILAPLVFSSIAESIDRGVALEMRGFHASASLSRAKPKAGGGSLCSWFFVFLAGVLLMWIIVRWLLLSP